MECDFVFGRNTDRERIEVLCIDDLSEAAPNLTVLASRCPTQGERRTAIRSLAALYLGAVALHEPLHQFLAAAEAEVATRRHVYLHMLNDPTATFADIYALLKARHTAETTVAPGGPGRSAAPGGDSHPAADGDYAPSALAGKELTLAAIQVAVSMPSFCATYERLRAMPHDTEAAYMDMLNLAFKSPSTLIHRYLHYGEATLEARHPLFGLLRPARSVLGLYLGQAIAVRPDRPTPSVLEFFSWGGAEEAANDEARRERNTVRFAGTPIQRCLFLQNKLACMDLVNAPGGFLGVDAVRDGTVALHVSLDQHYRLPTAFEGMKTFLGAVYIACGYPRQSQDGHTWHTLLDVFIEYLREGRSLAGAARKAHLDLCDVSFRTALRKIDDAARLRLTEANPGEAPFSAVLPFDSDGVTQLGQRLATREDATAFRLALGLEANGTAPLALEGSREARELDGGRRRQHDRDRRDHPERERGARDRDRRRDSPHPDAPLSASPSRSRDGDSDPSPARQSTVAVAWNSAHTAFTIGRSKPGAPRTRFDAAAIAAHHKCGIQDKCWPYLVSTKIGNARLTLCDGVGPEHDGHAASAHVGPPGWDAAAVRANPLWVKLRPAKKERRPRSRERD